MKVKIIDDTLRCHSVQEVTDQMRGDFAKAGNPIPDGTKILPLKDRLGRQAMETVQVEHIYEGRVLEIAITRAKRWIRSAKFADGVGAPHHIALALAAFHKADPDSFKELTSYGAA